MFYTVYKITNIINQKIYIGVHKTDDLNDGYMGSGVYLKNAQTKYGMSAFKKEYIQIFDNVDDMFKMESQLVNEEFVSRQDTYNLTTGGRGGYQFVNSNPEMKMAAAIKGREATDKILEERYGVEWRKELTKLAAEGRTEESYRLIAERAAKTIMEKYGHGVFYGKTHTEDSKQKIAKANKGKRTGGDNSQFGTCWVHSLTQQLNKKIKKDELETYIKDGWIHGRKMKF